MDLEDAGQEFRFLLRDHDGKFSLSGSRTGAGP